MTNSLADDSKSSEQEQESTPNATNSNSNSGQASEGNKAAEATSEPSRRERYYIDAPWRCYAMGWQARGGTRPRVAMGSMLCDSEENKLQVAAYNADDNCWITSSEISNS